MMYPLKQILITFTFLPVFTQACSVCFGAPSDPNVKAAKAGILFLLGVITFVLSGFIVFIYNMYRRNKKISN